jgi:hypothetical protein
MPSSTTSAASGLIKNHLSDELRSEILNGSLKPGERIVEEKSLAGPLAGDRQQRNTSDIPFHVADRGDGVICSWLSEALSVARSWRLV